MKKLSKWAPLLKEQEEKELSNLQKSWRDYFKSKLDKFGANSPADLSEEDKKNFFNELKKDWERGEGPKSNGVRESRMYEEKISTDEEFKEYAQTVLKKAFGNEYDSKKANKTIQDILDTVNGDYGAAIGILTSGLG
jgi:hypothetical protein